MTKEKQLSVTGAMLSLPWCCIIPGVLSLLGLAGVAVAGSITAGLMPYLLIVSATFLGRAHYLLYVKKQGNIPSHVIVWLSTALALSLWAVRWRLL